MTTILNLGCGTKTAAETINIDWSIMLRIVRNPVLRTLARMMLSKQRNDRLDQIGGSIVVHDLSKGIPYPDSSVDAVYHSHILEHIDRDLDNPAADAGLNFTRECLRVLRPGGVLRIVVPDLEHRCRAYMDSIARYEVDPAASSQHDRHVHRLIGQAAMRSLPGTKMEHRLVQKLEMAILGDARKRGLTHQWEYDRISLHQLLVAAGFSDIRQVDYATSGIPRWPEIGLDLNERGQEYKPHSIYFEAKK